MVLNLLRHGVDWEQHCPRIEAGFVLDRGITWVLRRHAACGHQRAGFKTHHSSQRQQHI
jgi:hypothetical protein